MHMYMFTASLLSRFSQSNQTSLFMESKTKNPFIFVCGNINKNLKDLGHQGLRKTDMPFIAKGFPPHTHDSQRKKSQIQMKLKKVKGKCSVFLIVRENVTLTIMRKIKTFDDENGRETT